MAGVGLLKNYLAEGLLADRTDPPANVSPDTLCFYHAQDTHQLFVYNFIDVTWQEVGGGLAVSQLSDVDFTTPPTDGQTIVWDATAEKWIPGSSGGGGSSTARYWGLGNWYANPASDAASMSAIEFISGGIPLSVPTVVRSLDASNAIANAFDGDSGTFWSNYGQTGTYAIFDFTDEVSVDQISVTCRSDNHAQVPVRFDVWAGDTPEQMRLVVTVFCGVAWTADGEAITFDIPT